MTIEKRVAINHFRRVIEDTVADYINNNKPVRFSCRDLDDLLNDPDYLNWEELIYDAARTAFSDVTKYWNRCDDDKDFI